MILTALSSVALISLGIITVSNADGLYPKGSAVMQIDGKSYDKLIAKSGKTSVSSTSTAIKVTTDFI